MHYLKKKKKKNKRKQNRTKTTKQINKQENKQGNQQIQEWKFVKQFHALIVNTHHQMLEIEQNYGKVSNFSRTMDNPPYMQPVHFKEFDLILLHLIMYVTLFFSLRIKLNFCNFPEWSINILSFFF